MKCYRPLRTAPGVGVFELGAVPPSRWRFWVAGIRRRRIKRSRATRDSGKIYLHSPRRLVLLVRCILVLAETSVYRRLRPILRIHHTEAVAMTRPLRDAACTEAVALSSAYPLHEPRRVYVILRLLPLIWGTLCIRFVTNCEPPGAIVGNVHHALPYSQMKNKPSHAPVATVSHLYPLSPFLRRTH